MRNKKIVFEALLLILVFALCACNSGEQTKPASQPSSNVATEKTGEPDEGRGDIFEEQVPDGADTIRQGVYYYELAKFSGDYGDGLSPREGAELTDNLLSDIGLYSDNGGVPADKCVYISLDELAILDSVVGRECYIYTVGIGTPEGGLMGDDYQVVYRVSVDYSGEKTAAIYEDFSAEYNGDGRGDLITDDEGRGDLIGDPGDTFTLTLYADLSGGSTTKNIQTMDISLPIEGTPASQALIAFALADGLSEWTGLDFALNDVKFGDNSITVDWSASSTLIAGLGNRKQKEDFHFYDAVSLNWFMMDSLAQTLKNNLDITTVYYCSDGGAVTFTNPEDMAAQGLPELLSDQPYEGSAFFVSHSNAQ